MSYGRNDGRNDCRIYVGNLPPDIRTKDVEEFFHKYGKIVFVDLKNRKGPPFAFVEFDDPRDAEDAVRSRDGYDYDGYRLRVEFPRGSGPRGPGGRRFGSSGGGGVGGGGGGRGGGPSRRTNYRVQVTGLPPSGSWQDLKDHMREAGDVCYSDVFRDGTGIVEYLRYEDMKYALRKLDDSKFRSHEGETAYVRVREPPSDRERERNGRRSRSRSRSRSATPTRRVRGSPTYSPAAKRGRSASGSRSKSRSRSRSKSRSRSPAKSVSRSRSRSAAKSRSRSRSRS